VAFALVAFGGANPPACTSAADSTRPLVTFVCASDSHAVGAGAVTGTACRVAAPNSAIKAAILMRGSLYRSEQRGDHRGDQPAGNQNQHDADQEPADVNTDSSGSANRDGHSIEFVQPPREDAAASTARAREQHPRT
jgi:hypothetical protein